MAEIKGISKKDFPEVIAIINAEFPYVCVTKQKLLERIESGRVFVFKAVEEKKLGGFVEIELLDNEMGRINGLSVKEGLRGKGIGKQLIGHAINFLRERGIRRVMLLVKQDNREAKKIYGEAGFSFVGLYHRKLDDAVVEEMEFDLGGSAPEYVS